MDSLGVDSILGMNLSLSLLIHFLNIIGSVLSLHEIHSWSLLQFLLLPQVIWIWLLLDMILVFTLIWICVICISIILPFILLI